MNKIGSSKNAVAECLIGAITVCSDNPLDFVVATNSGAKEDQYPKLRLIHNCCGFSVENGVASIDIVARGDDGAGPFRFIWPPHGVETDRAACLGMPLLRVTPVAIVEVG